MLEASCTLLPLDIPTIELAGGSVRCMLVGIHLDPRPQAASARSLLRRVFRVQAAPKGGAFCDSPTSNRRFFGVAQNLLRMRTSMSDVERSYARAKRFSAAHCSRMTVLPSTIRPSAIMVRASREGEREHLDVFALFDDSAARAGQIGRRVRARRRSAPAR